MKNIAFFGLGRMGLPMAKRLVAAGYRLTTAVHRNAAPAEELRSLGAEVLPSPAEAVREADVVITILPADREIEELLFAPEVFEAVKPGAVILEMSTASPRCAREAAERYAAKGVRFFDAPVSGGVKGAAEGTLTVIGGGSPETLEEIRPVLEKMAARIFLVGDAGAGKAVKSINQIMVSANTMIAAEAVSYARKLGVAPEKMLEVVSASTGASAALSAKFEKLVNADYNPGFTLALMKKDLKIALSEAGNLPLPIANLVYQLFLLAGPERESLDYTVAAELLNP
ncbi:MAG: NAD(P)-dependent oxidoreductase [Aminivibrio sp.]|jgi:3-hydroxyisobutyrate dehydrogenase-like beta-hydroxyacid dehydrogenase|nr:NAD(P)-dependent oxidoreductase [Synergistaceae bacterium]